MAPDTVPPSLPPALGFVQFPVRPGEIKANLESLKKGLDRVCGPGLVVLPELWATGFAWNGLPDLARETPGLLEFLAEESNRRGLVLAGSLLEEVETPEGKSFANTLFVVEGQGVAGRYRKQQLFAPLKEDRYLIPGHDPAVIEAQGTVIGPLVCFDLRFPDIARSHATQGATVLAVSAQWPASRREHFQTLLRARAMENQLFVVAANSCGNVSGERFGGGSMVVSPQGDILARAGEGEDAQLVGVDAEALMQSRTLFRTAGVTPYRFPDAAKIVPLEELARKVRRFKSLGRKLVFTNGCFDILHPGHVSYLEQARRLGDLLIVGVNSDRSVKSLGKGDDRPVNPEASRARVLAALGCVDYVVVFDEETPLAVICELMPDVLVKGGDWPVERIVGAAEVLAHGGKVHSLPLHGDHSTTRLIEKIRGR